LAWVTPWNNRGYDIVALMPVLTSSKTSKIFRGKFDYVAPCWYQLLRTSTKDGAEWQLRGDHDVDNGWMLDVREPVEGGRRAKIVPRVIFEDVDREGWEAFSRSEEESAQVTELLLSALNTHSFDGFIVEAPVPLMYIPVFLSHLAHVIHAQNGLLMCTVQVYHREHPQIEMLDSLFTSNHMEALLQVVDRVALVTYDYSTSIGKRGPNSPAKWIEEAVKRICPSNDECRKRLLLGVNCYGQKFDHAGASAVLGPQYLEILEKYNPAIVWNSEFEEHVTRVPNVAEVWYPSPLFLENRVGLAEDLGTGIHFWEVGQGLDVFFVSFAFGFDFGT
ncbi:glycoside hydrolase family 18 protein, partial [Gonapodya prolifera JEL478]